MQALSDPEAFDYWATEVYWQTFGTGNGGTAYFGLQPNGDAIDGSLQPIALFSVFGTGTSATSEAQCVPGADGGPGQSCRIAYPWTVGTTYQFDMKLASNDGTNETWVGSVTNASTGTTNEIASWTVPSSWGLLTQTTVSFAEYYGYVSTCEAQPYARAQFDTPIGFLAGVAYPGQQGHLNIHGPCGGFASATADSSGYIVETGLGQKPSAARRHALFR